MRDDRARFPVALETKQRLVERFICALEADDQDAILALVGANATFISDGGGRVSAARNILHGAVRIIRIVLGLEKKYRGAHRHEIAWINGEPAVATLRERAALLHDVARDQWRAHRRLLSRAQPRQAEERVHECAALRRHPA